MAPSAGCRRRLLYFFFDDTPTTEIYTLSLHDALPISRGGGGRPPRRRRRLGQAHLDRVRPERRPRSEEHTSELQSPDHLVCRLLLEKKKTVDALGRLRPLSDACWPLHVDLDQILR